MFFLSKSVGEEGNVSCDNVSLRTAELSNLTWLPNLGRLFRAFSLPCILWNLGRVFGPGKDYSL